MDEMNENFSDLGSLDERERVMRARLGAMEREMKDLKARNTWLSYGIAAAVLVATIPLIFPRYGGPGEDDVIRARGLVILDEKGAPRGEWSVDETGNTSFAMLDQERRQRLTLTVRSEGFPGLSLSNAVGEKRVALGLLPDETTSLVFADGAGVPRTVLGLVRGDAASLVLADADGVSRIGLGLDGRGYGSVILPDADSPAEQR